MSIPNLPEYFGRWSYPDITVAQDISVDAVRKIYYAGVQRLLSVIIEMDSIKKMTEEERKKGDVAKQKRYLEMNRDKVNARRRAHYKKTKDQANSGNNMQERNQTKYHTDIHACFNTSNI